MKSAAERYSEYQKISKSKTALQLKEIEAKMDKAEKTSINLTNYNLLPEVRKILVDLGYEISSYRGRYNDTELVISWKPKLEPPPRQDTSL